MSLKKMVAYLNLFSNLVQVLFARYILRKRPGLSQFLEQYKKEI